MSAILNTFYSVYDAFRNFTKPTSDMLIVDYSGRAFKWNETEDINQLIEDINSKPYLEVLNLSGNILNDCTAEVLACALKNKSNLKKLYLNDLFTGRDIDVIKKCLEYIFRSCVEANAKLEVLNLSDNALGHRGIELLKILTETECLDSLEHLIMNNNGLGETGAKSFCFIFNEWFNKLENKNTICRLTSVELGRNRLEDEGTKFISSPLKRIRGLKNIQIYQNGIRDIGISHFVEVLRANTSIKTLNLNDNLFVESGSEMLAEVFVDLRDLKDLDLGDSLIRNKGACAIFKSLENHNLKKLNLGFNELTGEIAEKALDLIEFMDGFELLILDGNMFGEKLISKIKERLGSENFKSIEVSIEDDEALSEPVSESETSEVEDLVEALEKTKIDS